MATFSTVAGLPHHVHDHYFNKYAGELAWTRLVPQNVETTCRTPLPAGGGTNLDATALAE